MLNEARFRDALALFERAARSDDLRREDLVHLLEGRALAHHALGNDGAMDEQLRMLAALDPTHAFPAHVPPEVAWRFRMLASRSPGRLRVRVRASRRDRALDLRAEVEGDPGGLVRDVMLSARTGSGPWQRGTHGVTSLDVSGDAHVEYRVVVVGLGGAPLLEVGSEDAALPLLVSAPTCASAASGSEPASRVEIWPFLVGGALTVGAVVVALSVALDAVESDRTAPTAPTFALGALGARFR